MRLRYSEDAKKKVALFNVVEDPSEVLMSVGAKKHSYYKPNPGAETLSPIDYYGSNERSIKTKETHDWDFLS